MTEEQQAAVLAATIAVIPEDARAKVYRESGWTDPETGAWREGGWVCEVQLRGRSIVFSADWITTELGAYADLVAIEIGALVREVAP